MPAVAALELPAVVLTQDRDGVLVQGDGPAAGGGLRVALDDLVTGGGALPFDEQQSAVEVDGCLFESAELAADEARKDELVGARDHGDAGLSSAESQLLDAALRDDARERDRVLARNPADGWSMELLSAAFVLVARRWWDERWDRRVIHAFARRFVEQAPGGSGLVVRDVEAMVRAATGELSLAASLADAQKLPELPYALLLALADDLDMRDAEVGPLLAEAAREATAALSMVEPLEGAVNGPVALRRYRRIHRRYLTDDDVVLSRPEPPRQPRPVAAVRGGGGHAGPTTRAGRFLRSYLLGVDGPAAGEVSEADRFRIMRTTLSEALWLYLPEDPDLREISTLVHLARTAYPQDVDPMKAEYAIRLIMGENVSLDGMKKSDIYRASAALLQVIAEWWQHDETVLTELIEDAERTLTRQGTVLAG